MAGVSHSLSCPHHHTVGHSGLHGTEGSLQSQGQKQWRPSSPNPFIKLLREQYSRKGVETHPDLAVRLRLHHAALSR